MASMFFDSLFPHQVRSYPLLNAGKWASRVKSGFDPFAFFVTCSFSITLLHGFDYILKGKPEGFIILDILLYLFLQHRAPLVDDISG